MVSTTLPVYAARCEQSTFQLGTGTLMAQEIIDGNLVGDNTANYDLNKDVELAGDGSFDVVLSMVRPDTYTGD